MPIIHDGKNIVDRLHGGAPLVKKYHGDRLVWSKHIEARLPLAYQEVEYIQANGNQWCDIPYTCSKNTVFDVEFEFTQLNGTKNCIMGCNVGPGIGGDLRSARVLIQKNTGATNFSWGVGLWHKRTYQGDKTTTTNPYNFKGLAEPEINKRYKVVAKAGEVLFNNVPYPMNTYEDPKTKKTLATSIRLCADAYNATEALQEYSNGRVKLYSLRVYEGDVILNNIVPCYRKSDRKTGVYDTVTDTFYSSETDVDFFVGANVKCNKLEFIENPNSNFIDLKLKMNSAYTTEIDYQYNKYTVGFLFGSRSSNTDRTTPSTDPDKAYSVLLGTTKENFDVCNVFSSAARYQQDYNSDRRKVRINKEGLWIDGNKKKSFNKDAFTTVNSAFIFSCPYCLIGDTKTVGFTDAKIYSLTIKDATNVLKMNLIPYKIGDIAGLLDTVSKVFFIGELVDKPFVTKESRRR